MRRILMLILSGTAAVVFSVAFAGSSVADDATKTESPKQFIKCSTCGAEFTARAGYDDHVAKNPGHMAATEPLKPLIKCSTCGAEFTSSAGLTDHVNANPAHSGKSRTLVKCSTCGVEFTSSPAYEEHMRTHSH